MHTQSVIAFEFGGLVELEGHVVQVVALLVLPPLFQNPALQVHADAVVEPLRAVPPGPHHTQMGIPPLESFHVLAGHGNVLEMHVDVVGSHIFPVAQSVGPKGQSEAGLSPEAIVDTGTQQQARR